MKSLKPLILLLLFPTFGFTQSLNGVYTGVLSNDSTTIRRDQSFEMALTEYNGKVYGYAYSTFIVNDTLYYIVKRVKGKVDGDVCEVEDDDVISHNFPQKPEKKVYVTYTLRRNESDSIWRLDGNWKTNLTKKYYAISGKVETKEEKDLSKSKLFEHLGDLDLQKTLVLTKPGEKTPETKPVKPKVDKTDIAKNTIKKNEEKNTESKPVDKRSDASITKADTKIPDNKPGSETPQPGPTEKKDAVAASTHTTTDKKSEPAITKTETKVIDNKTATASSKPPIQNEKKDITPSNPNAIDKKPENNIAKADTRLPDNKTLPATTNNTQVQNVTNRPSNDKKPDVAKTENQPQNNVTNTNPVTAQPTQNVKKDPVVSNAVDKTQPANVAKADYGPQANSNNVAINNQVKQEEKKTIVPPNSNAVAKTNAKTPDNKTTNPGDEKADPGFEFQELKRTSRTLKPAAQLVDGRTTTPSETIFFSSDSLSIALYDNGEVDGDTVSVIINDEMFIEKQGLKSTAFRKTFYIPPADSDSLLVVLYAENLGKYPPNTGLLQIKDGEEIFYVRFKADLDKNAAIVLRRKYR
ncbi:MAG TPA: hypothetical protein VFP97_09730 [Chitinophagaceae bacterium]|nr:hypothetical protein [Chitinophagaceae bacterium]